MNKKVLIIIGIVLVVIIIIAVILSIVLKKNPDDGTNNTNNNNGQVTLVYWGLWEPESVMKPIIDQYEATHPGVNIEYTQKSFTQYAENSYTRIVQGTTSNTPAPDIIKIHNTWLPKYQDYLAPMPSTIMTAQEYKNTFYPTVSEDFTGDDGKIYAMPIGIDGLTLFYNKKLLKEAGYDTPPTDWDTFTEAAKKLTKKDSDGNITQAGVAMGTSKNIIHSADILNLLMLQNGVDVLPEGEYETNLDSNKAAISLDFYVSFYEEHKVWSADSRNELEMFYAGKLAMFFAPSWRAFDIATAAPQIEFGMAPVPQIANNENVNYAMYWGEAVSKKSSYQEEAWKFIEYLSEPAQLKTMYQNSSSIRLFGQPYPRVDMAGDMSTNKYVNPVLQMAPTMDSWKMGDQSYIEESLKTAINSVSQGSSTSNSALREAKTRIDTKLAEYKE